MKKSISALIDEHYNIVISVFGRRGSGKTFLCSKICREFDKVFIFDTRGRLSPVESKTHDAHIEGSTVIVGIDNLVKFIADNGGGRKSKYRVIYRPLDIQNEFLDFCYYMDSKELDDVLVYIEEIGILTNSQHVEGIPPEFEKLLRFGRHNRLHLLLNSQRPQDVHRLITAESSHIICFQQIENRDLQYFAGYFDSRKLTTLEKYSFLMWHDNNVKIYDKNLTIKQDGGNNIGKVAEEKEVPEAQDETKNA